MRVWQVTLRVLKSQHGKSDVVQTVGTADPPRRFTLFVDGTKGASRRGRFNFTYEFVPDGDGTSITLNGTLSGLTWFWEQLARLFIRSMRKSCAGDLRAMKTYIESQSTTLRHSTAVMRTFTPRDAAQTARRPT